ncbi:MULTISPECIES: DUF2255 family protein [Rhizobium]|uniref:DUF2255 family protein n=1 Tax=Rhizobium tropici TaxID=398 RepID=A0ABR6QW86_RHITR|nr:MULTISPECIES: DUF2255 family protein [Rhizobium]AGB73976.1 hypothetical protein RTCIAT899_PC00840 [Rhizobium tropici CIAT 899]MBB4240460.1 hypothetical protein [Rhizobium tropici]MBB5592124.1 hypothetical protein [Rhizobium tropici]MBB6491179.1 hypothetical protein [Rhizobium tropici]
MNWSQDELAKIDQANDLKIAPFREDGATYGTPTWIWEVVVDGSLYVRGYHGQKSRWYQAALHQKAGRIIAAGMTRDVGARSRQSGLIAKRKDSTYEAFFVALIFRDEVSA